MEMGMFNTQGILVKNKINSRSFIKELTLLFILLPMMVNNLTWILTEPWAEILKV